jgi:hypothetical protein
VARTTRSQLLLQVGLAVLIGTRAACPCGVEFESLSLRSHVRKSALPGRLELPTLRLTASRSNQLSYGSKWAKGIAAFYRSNLIAASCFVGSALLQRLLWDGVVLRTVFGLGLCQVPTSAIWLRSLRLWHGEL